jgi:hypothetical protein
MSEIGQCRRAEQRLDRFGLRFDHFGLAVSEPKRACAFLADLGYEIGPHVHDPLQNVNLIFCRSTSMPAVELIFPAGSPGPLDSILVGRTELIYHLCFECESEANSIAAMKESGHRIVCVSPQKPAALLGGRPVSFYLVRGFGLIEVVERSLPSSDRAP